MSSGKEQKLLVFLFKQLGIINWKGEEIEKSRYEVGRVVTWENQELHFIHGIFEITIRYPNEDKGHNCMYVSGVLGKGRIYFLKIQMENIIRKCVQERLGLCL